MEPIEKDDHFIPDGMNAFERNVKRIGDCFLALGALIVCLLYTSDAADD